jgi:hypothetical protein
MPPNQTGIWRIPLHGDPRLLVPIYTFLDLDDTLFQTLPKCPPGEPSRCVAFRKDGAPLSYMTRRQEQFFEALAAAGTLVPVTARNLDAFRRVTLPFTSFAVLDFGGVILQPDGTPDRAWDAEIRPQAVKAGSELNALLAALERFIEQHGLGVRACIISDLDMPLYIVMKHPDGDLTTLRRVINDCLPALDVERFLVHANHNNLSLVPRYLGKECAVRFLLNRFGSEALCLGVGDSLSDVPFLLLCDFMIVPRGTQLSEAIGTCLLP